MAADTQSRILSLPDTDFIARFVYDVIARTLRTCGMTRTIVVLNSRENVYSRPNFVSIAAVSVLRMCLSMRDEWRATFRNLPRESVYDVYFFSSRLSPIVKMGQEEGEGALQFNVDLTLAMCNEMALFFFSENIRFNFIHLIGAATTNIMYLIEPPAKSAILSRIPNAPRPDFKQELQKLFPDFENIWELSRWLENFIQTYAVPYGSRTNVSKIFYREVKKRWEDIVEKQCGGRQPSNEKVKINLGFLPKDVYDEIAAGKPMPSYSEMAWGRKPPKSTSSERGADEEKKSRRRRPTGSGIVSKETAQGGHGSKDSSKPAAQVEQAGEDSTKPAAQVEQAGEDSTKPAAQVEQAGEDSTKPTAQGDDSGKDSSKPIAEGDDSGKDSSKPTAQSDDSGKDSSKLLIEKDFSQMDLGAEESSQAK